MFWMMNDWNRRVGPRGHRRPRIGLGFGGLLLLPALMFGGWMILAVIGGLLGAVVMILGSVFSGLAAVADGLFSGITSVGGLGIGIVIGLALYFRMKKRNTVKEEAAQKDNIGAVDGVEVEQIIAPEHMYRSND